MLTRMENGEVITLSAQEEAAKLAEWAANQASTNVLNAKKARISEYGSWHEHIDMMYADKVNGTTTWLDFMKNLNEKFPKI